MTADLKVMDVRRVAAALVFCLMVTHHHIRSQPTPNEEVCNLAADVIFVLDVSSSIWPVRFHDHVLKLVRDVINKLDVGPGPTHTRVAALTFGNDVIPEFFLNSFMNKEALLQRLSQIESRGGNTNTHLALQFVDEFVLSPEHGSRPYVPHVVVIITDGVSREIKITRDNAQILKDHGATIFAIGVGKERDYAQLVDMASSPSERYVFEVEHFQMLNRIKNRLVNKTCQVKSTPIPISTTITSIPTTTFTTPPTTTTMTTFPTPTPEDDLDFPVNDRPVDNVDPRACLNRPADIYFVLDSSSSIWQYHFNHQIMYFVRNVTNLYDVDDGRTRVGVITYSNTPRTVFGLNSYNHKDDLIKAMNPKRIKYTPGETNTAQALDEAGDMLKLEGRSYVEKMILLITDGVSKDPNKTISTANKLRQQGVRVLAVGVGEEVDQEELRAVAGNDVVMMVDDFDALARYSSQLAARSCAPEGNPVQKDDPSRNRCSLGQADVVFAYDWTTLGTRVVSQLSTTLHHLSTTLHARGADVRLGMMTSRACMDPPQTVPLSSGAVISKYAQGMVRSQLLNVLKTVQLSAFSASNSHRQRARKVVVTVLDTTRGVVPRQVVLEAAKMREQGVEMFVVTSGGGGQGRQLAYELVSQPALGHVIALPDLRFYDVAFFSDAIAGYLCGKNQAFK